jgi:hypothetical protein
MESIKRGFPELFMFPFARSFALEDRAGELAMDLAIRQFVAAAISDSGSDIWVCFVQDGLSGLLGVAGSSEEVALRIPSTARSFASKAVSRALSIAVPHTAVRIVVKPQQPRLYVYTVLLRSVVLKH